MKKQLFKTTAAVILAALATASCSKNESATPDEPIAAGKGKFLLATSVNASGSSPEATYLIPVENLEDENASISIKGNGYEFLNTFSNYIPNAYDGFVALKYGQGNAHVGQRFTIDATTGKATTIGAQFELQNGFITAGLVGNMVYTIMSGGRASDPTIATVNRIGLNDPQPQFVSFKVNEFKGYEGKNGWLIGIADAGDGSFYTSVDLSSEGIDDVVVAKIDKNVKTQAVFSDPRLPRSGAAYRSARYSQIGLASNGDVYVFAGNQGGTKKAGALLIKKGAAAFDKDYFWDIETAADGNRFRKVWELSGNKFLLEFYNDKVAPHEANASMATATHYAIVDASTKSLKWVTGLPSKADIPDLGIKWPYVYNGKIYMGVKTSQETPRVYVIDIETAAAKKGVSVQNIDAIDAITFVKPN
ncbi:DUF4374 domain-containing protein [Sphingobacterium sp. Mn56C]|uniref:DUF4374 domain-containing protein n=1 Tax=Sphingobacterium sp. Mn56C TaxID=3395261 RepID=UPI003BC4CA9E